MSLVSLPRSGGRNLAVGLWSLKIKCNNVGAGFPRPIAWLTERGGANPPLRQVMWLRLIFKGHQPAVGVIFITRRVSDD